MNKKKLSEKLNLLRKNKKKILLCHGVFDVVHIGHIMHFQSAKKEGDVLVVSLTKSKFIKKGPGRPIFNDKQRIEFLNSLKIVDFVYLCETDSAEDAIKFIKPDLYIKGPDYKDNKKDKTKKIYKEKALVQKYGGRILYTSDEKYSSTKIINNYNYNLNKEQINYIKQINKKYSLKKILNYFNQLKNKKFLVFGELIVDHYKYGDVIGKAGKEPHLVFKENFEEFYAGGSSAVARHISPFVQNVDLLCSFDKKKKFKNILNQQLRNNINITNVLSKKISTTIVKTRFLDKNSNYKMFGSYKVPGRFDEKYYFTILNKFKSKLKRNSSIILCDYGHNFVDDNLINYFNKLKIFRSVNSQVNSSTSGFTSVSKYKKINLMVINETELRQELRETSKDIFLLSKKFAKNQKIQNLIVTRGTNGALLVDNYKKIFNCPAFAIKSVDKIGAGDSVLAFSSLLLSINVPKDLTLFISSLAASQSIQSVGNKETVDKTKLLKDIEFLLNV